MQLPGRTSWNWFRSKSFHNRFSSSTGYENESKFNKHMKIKIRFYTKYTCRQLTLYCWCNLQKRVVKQKDWLTPASKYFFLTFAFAVPACCKCKRRNEFYIMKKKLTPAISIFYLKCTMCGDTFMNLFINYVFVSYTITEMTSHTKRL